MISSRTASSLAQFLNLQDPQVRHVLLVKHDVWCDHPGTLIGLQHAIERASAQSLSNLLAEVARTQGDLRASVSPKHRYDERWEDLSTNLLLDGYKVENRLIIPMDPSIPDAIWDDELTASLSTCGAPRAAEIIERIDSSTRSFRSNPPNFNACLNDTRVALETLASDIASHRVPPGAPGFDSSKWGSVIQHLRLAGFLTQEEEKGLAGLFSFLSPGSHRPIGITEAEMARLGRSLGLNMCWFLLKRQLGTPTM